MWFRLPRAEYEAGKGAVNRRRLRALVDQGRPVGILAYEVDRPVGWCSIAPRTEHPRLTRSRTMKPVDERALWSILCLFVDRSHRERGLSVELIRASARWARDQGAPGVEAFPVIPHDTGLPPVFASQGLLSAYLQAGFREVRRPSPTRAVVVWP